MTKEGEMVDVQTLQRWVGEVLSKQGFQISPLSGDAGFRRYFRVASSPASLAVLSPLDRAHNQGFVDLAEFLRNQGIQAPKIMAVEAEQGFMLVEDFGDRLLLHELTPDSATSLYGEALMVLLRWQQCPRPHGLPDYDTDQLIGEMTLFQEWFITKLLGYSLTQDERYMLENVFEYLAKSAIEQPQVLVHRDYHSRNLILCEGGGLGVIDFQDALWGPFTYDLVSLLKDCYVRWAPDQVQRWALAYGDMLIEAGAAAVTKDITQAQFLGWFDLMGMQRHIKVLGIFSRLSLRDDKAGYLNDLPLVMRYVLETAASYPSLSDFLCLV